MDDQDPRPTLHEVFSRAWKEDSARFPFEGKMDYPRQLQNSEELLFKQFHPQVEALALAHGSGYLTKHGPQHIRDVMRQAADLCAAVDAKLSGYEAYLLIMAVHFHDLGNMFGRAEHEKKIASVMQGLGERLGTDRPEKKLIESIARAHGGYVDRDKKDPDTLAQVLESARIGRIDVRPQFLAALLRFADELAEDRTRANVPVIELLEWTAAGGAGAALAKAVSQIPAKSEIYHRYAGSIYSCVVVPSERLVAVEYEVRHEDTQRKFRKDEAEVFLFDEIQSRIYKLRNEMIYFSRHSAGRVRLVRLRATVEIVGEDASLEPIETIRYDFHQRGYPEIHEGSDLTTLLSRSEAQHRDLDGERLAEQLRAKVAGALAPSEPA